MGGGQVNLPGLVGNSARTNGLGLHPLAHEISLV